MDNIVDIVDLMDARQSERASRSEHHSVAEERFLIEEGLGLLAAYRAIQDDDVRHAIRIMVDTLARTN